MKTPPLGLLTEIGDDRGNLEILTEFLTGNYQFRPNAESFGGHGSKCNLTLQYSAGIEWGSLII